MSTNQPCESSPGQGVSTLVSHSSLGTEARLRLTGPNNTVWHNATITRENREKLNGHKALVLWFTGLSGSGKSTIAHAVEEHLHRRGCRTYVFDGDNVRHGLCSDLGFSAKDRSENVRRVAEMVKLFLDAGVIALTAFISPFKEHRNLAKRMIGEDFLEIYCRCPLEVCEARDKKGIYQRARDGLIKEFTGISSPYEEPDQADLVLETNRESLEVCVQKVLQLALKRIFS
ncbi:MAG: adenylyl-sulfate kinase [Nitrospira sp.]|nr:adenylyl-sulfate kinase [Nitrospira sp.]MCP9463398.1 adenylyl-sulfate kinase [Nitrospira sp.]